MKKSAFFLLTVLCLAMSCKKESLSPTYFLRADINGIPTSFDTSLRCIRLIPGGRMISLDISGFTNASSTPTWFGLYLENDSSNPMGTIFRTGVYTDTSIAFNLSCAYQVFPSNVIYVANENVFIQAIVQGYTIKHQLRVDFTAIDSVHVAGTFSGDFFPDQGPLVSPVTITNGSFNVKFSN